MVKAVKQNQGNVGYRRWNTGVEKRGEENKRAQIHERGITRRYFLLSEI